MKTLAFLVFIIALPLQAASPEYEITVGHTTHETLSFLGVKQGIRISSAGASFTKKVPAAKYSKWLADFKKITDQGSFSPLCTREVGLKDHSVCLDGKPALDSQLAKMWKEVRAELAKK